MGVTDDGGKWLYSANARYSRTCSLQRLDKGVIHNDVYIYGDNTYGSTISTQQL